LKALRREGATFHLVSLQARSQNIPEIHSSSDGRRISIIRPLSDDVHNYLNRIHFYSHLGIDVDYPWERHDPTGRFIEIQNPQTEKQGEQVADDIIKILENHLYGLENIKNGMNYALNEIVNNVFHHAASPVHGVICAQSYPKNQRIDVAVVDFGRGIAASLRSNPENKISSNEEALRLAIQQRVTGRPGYNSGEGLFFTTEIIRANQGEMVLYSGDGGLFFDEQGMRYQSGSIWPGTIVGLTFRMDKPINTQAIFDRYAPPENDFDWLFGNS
jgi:anti-sigma regulatory factor (Ser/Thr protein kinase)